MSVIRSSQPKDILRVEQPPVLPAEPATYYLHLRVPHSSTRRSALLIPSFNSFHDFINFCEAPPPNLVVPFSDCFIPSLVVPHTEAVSYL